MGPWVPILIVLAAEPYSGSALAKDEAKSGWKLVAEKSADMDGDGEPEAVVLDRRPSSSSEGPEHRLTLLEQVKRRFEVWRRTEPLSAARVGQFRIERFGGRPGVLLSLERDAPDEVVHRVMVFRNPSGDPLRPDLDRTFTLPREPIQRADRAFGDAAPGWFVRKDDTGVWIAHVTGPRLATLSARGGGKRTYAVGADEVEYRFEGGQFVETKKFRDFLRPHTPSAVDASQQVAKVWGTAQAFWATDGDPGTAWSVKPGLKDEPTLTLRYDAPVQVRVLRIVPGCAASSDAWLRGHRVRRFRIDLGGTLEATVDLEGELPPGIEAMQSYPMGKAGHGEQVYLVLERPSRLQWAELELVAAAPPRGEPPLGEVCVSEFSLH